MEAEKCIQLDENLRTGSTCLRMLDVFVRNSLMMGASAVLALVGTQWWSYTLRGVRNSVLKRSYPEYLFLSRLSICTTTRTGPRIKFVVLGDNRFHEVPGARSLNFFGNVPLTTFIG